MDLSPDQFPPADFLGAVRKDGWSPERKARFLTILAEAGNVRLAARRCGLSAQSAYVQRRRDPLFARGWDAALELARPFCEQVLADRAIDGIEEEIWYKGELVGTRRRYDSRLLLAHLARLDARAGSEQAEQDAQRFDEIVALVAGAEVPGTMSIRDDLPPSRETRITRAVALALDEARETLPLDCTEDERDAFVFDAIDAAEAGAVAEFTDWFDHACDVVDGLAEDRVNPSTSPQDRAPALRLAGRPAAQDKLPSGQAGASGGHTPGSASPHEVPACAGTQEDVRQDSVNPSTSQASLREDLVAARARIVAALAARQDSVNPSTSTETREDMKDEE